MAEEFVELGFEGLDRFADRYFDRTYDCLPNLPRPGKKRQPQSGHVPSENVPQHPDKSHDYELEPDRYGAGGQDGYARDQGYYEANGVDYMNRAPGPGFRVRRDGPEQYGGWSTQPYVQAGQRAGDRPEAHRRGSSWSPRRFERQGRSESRRGHAGPRSGSQSRAADAKHGLIAMIGGALVGGLAGSQVGRGKQYDSATTVAGALLGGVGAKEAADDWDRARQRKREQRGERRQGDYRNSKWHDEGRR